MEQPKYNKYSLYLSVLALILSIGFPYFKEKILDKPELNFTSSDYLLLSHTFGNVSVMQNVNFINTGQKPTIITKIEAVIFNGNNEIIFKKSPVKIFQQFGTSAQNFIVLNPQTENSFNLYYNYNDLDNEENGEELNRVNNEAIEELNRKGCNTLNSQTAAGNIELCKEVFDKIKAICNRNLIPLKSGDFKIVFLIYQNYNDRPSFIFGRRYKITEQNKNALNISIENYKYGSHIYNSGKLLYGNGVNIRSYELNNEEIKTLVNSLK